MKQRQIDFGLLRQNIVKMWSLYYQKSTVYGVERFLPEWNFKFFCVCDTVLNVLFTLPTSYNLR